MDQMGLVVAELMGKYGKELAKAGIVKTTSIPRIIKTDNNSTNVKPFFFIIYTSYYI